MKYFLYCFLLSLFLMSNTFAKNTEHAQISNYTMTKESLENASPDQALNFLITGNKRFVKNTPLNRNLLQQAKATSLHGQFPTTLILSCMDSRSPPEIIFDQGLGDVFSVRIAGNIVDEDQVGGMEYATKVVGTKLIVVMGHSKCGAVKGACQKVRLGNLTSLLHRIEPAVATVRKAQDGELNCDDYQTTDKIAKQNVLNMLKRIKDYSPIIKNQVEDKSVRIVGAMHDLSTGRVSFFDENDKEILKG